MSDIVDDPGRWIEPDPGRPLPFREALKHDIVAHVPPESRGLSRWGWGRMALTVALVSTGFRVVALYRMGHLLRHRAGPPGRLLSAFFFWWGRHWYGCAIASTARLHGGLILPHPQGIVIGPAAVVGPRAWIYQNVTIGGTMGKAGMPRVGSDCRIFTGAVLVGPIAVGDFVILGANVVVSRDVPSWHAVRSPQPTVSPLPGRTGADGPPPGES